MSCDANKLDGFTSNQQLEENKLLEAPESEKSWKNFTTLCKKEKNENNLLSSYEATAGRRNPDRRRRRRRKNDRTAPAAGEASQTLRWEIWGSLLVATLTGLEPATSKPWPRESQT